MQRTILVIGLLATAACGGGRAFDDGDAGIKAPDDASADVDVSSDANMQFGDTSAPRAEASTPLGCNLATIGAGGSQASNQFEAWLSQGGVGSLGDQTITTSLLAPFSVLIVQNLDQSHTYTTAEAQALHAWVESGGNVMTLTGYGGANEPTNVNTLLAPFDMQYTTSLVLCGCGVPRPITEWVSHPITTGITSMGFDNGYEVVGSGGTILASQTDNAGDHHVLRAATVGAGHVVVWGDEWISYDTVWTDYPQTITFWQNIIDWFAPQAGCVVPTPN